LPDTALCTAAAERAAATQVTAALNGTWDVTYTRSEFFDAGANSNENVPGNWGHMTLTFNRGRWLDIFPDVDPAVDGPASGTYVVKGDEVTFYRTDNAYPGSDTEIWGPYIWSVYRDTLTFRKTANGGGPTSLVVKPWRRAASAS
jgi:hypothetical protein